MEPSDQEIRKQELAELRSSNANKFMMIQQEGATLDPTSVTMCRLNTLIDCLWPEDSELRVLFEIAFESNIQTTLDSVETQLRRAKLLAPLPQQPPNLQGLIRPDGHKN